MKFWEKCCGCFCANNREAVQIVVSEAKPGARISEPNKAEGMNIDAHGKKLNKFFGSQVDFFSSQIKKEGATKINQEEEKRLRTIS